MESPTNPLLKVIDVEAIATIAHKYPNVRNVFSLEFPQFNIYLTQIIVVVDNTFLSAYLQRPLELGADIVMYSLTKYMNGHSDVIMGSAATSSEDLHQRLRFLQNGKTLFRNP